MTFYCIKKSKQATKKTINLFRNSAKKRNIKFKVLYSEDFNFLNIPQIEKGDITYNISIDKKSETLEKMLLNENATTLYETNKRSFYTLDNVILSTIIHKNKKLSIIKTVFDITTNKEVLKKYVKYLGGFPIVIKASGGSYGVGVVKIDSFSSLLSVADFMLVNDLGYILREYIDYKEHARLIVVGDKVVASGEYKRLKDDFRSNAAGKAEKLVFIPKKFSKEIENLAIQSVETLGYEFGGVDVLIDNNNNHYLAEVNFPCSFAMAQKLTKVDISGLIIDHLVEKSKKLTLLEKLKPKKLRNKMKK